MKTTGLHPHVVFAGGRSGGHLFPGLAVAERLAGEMPDARITFAGCGLEFERRHVARAGFDYLALPCRPLPRRLPDVPAFVAATWDGYRQAGRFLADQRVSVVVGLGGYVSVPMARAAIRHEVPLILLEQNAVPGRATRWLAPAATLVCTTFEQAHRYLSSRCCVRVTGNPVRAEFLRLGTCSGDGAVHGTGDRAKGSDGNGMGDRQREGPSGSDGNGRGDRDGDGAPDARGGIPAPGVAETSDGDRARLLLVLGGSAGARSLNQHVPRALHQVGSLLGRWKVVHQSGWAELEPTRELYRKLRVEATVVPFILDMPQVLARTDLALCRSGGTTLAELAASGVPAVLMPYPHAAGDHQRKNADVFVSAGACLTLDVRELQGRLDDHLAGAVAMLLGDPARRAEMSESMRRLAYPDATWDVATMVRQVANGRKQRTTRLAS